MHVYFSYTWYISDVCARRWLRRSPPLVSNTDVRPDEKPRAIQRPSGLQHISRTVPERPKGNKSFTGPKSTAVGRTVKASCSDLACVASVSDRVIARKLGTRATKKKKRERQGEGRGGEGREKKETLACKPHNSFSPLPLPTLLFFWPLDPKTSTIKSTRFSQY